MKQDQFTAALKFVAHAMGVRDNRIQLDAVLFDVRDGKPLRLVGTDGKRLAIIDVAGEHELVPGQYIIPDNQVKLILKAYGKRNKNSVDIPIMQENDKTLRVGIIACEPMDMRYPNYQQVYDVMTARATKIAAEGYIEQHVNASYMADACKAIDAISTTGQVTLELSTHSNHVIKLEAKSLPEGLSNAVVIVMPLKL